MLVGKEMEVALNMKGHTQKYDCNVRQGMEQWCSFNKHTCIIDF